MCCGGKPKAVDSIKICGACGSENDFFAETCKECGGKFPALPPKPDKPGSVGSCCCQPLDCR